MPQAPIGGSAWLPPRRWRGTSARPGFATITALLLLTIVIITLTTLSGLFALEARRTQRERSLAQVRQLLLAGGMIAQQRLGADQAGGIQSIKPELPGTLTGNGTSMSIALRPAGGPDQRSAVITVQINGRQSQEQVDLARQAGRWSVADARSIATNQPTIAPATQPENR